MVDETPKLKPIEIVKGMSWTAKSCFLFFDVAALAAIVYGMIFDQPNGLIIWGLVLVSAVSLCCFGIFYARTKKNLEERQKRLIEQSKTLAPVSPEWEKIRTEMNEIKGKLVKEILDKRSLNPQQDLLSGFLKKK
jgi:hypothetical protein